MAFTQVFTGAGNPVARQPGRDGVTTYLLDCSGSMSGEPLQAVMAILGEMIARFGEEGLIVIPFGSNAFACSPAEFIHPAHHERLVAQVGYSNSTLGFEVAAQFQPSQSILMSDGMVYTDCLREHALGHLFRCSGAVSTIWLYERAVYDEGKRNMEEIARLGGGRCAPWSMAKEGMQALRTLLIGRQRHDHVYDMPAEIIDHGSGAPRDVNMTRAQTNVSQGGDVRFTVHRPPSKR